MAVELHLPRAIADEMIEHCIAEKPREACGVLAVNEGQFVASIKMRNVSSRPVRRYRFDKPEQLNIIYKLLPERGWDLGAVYHSHPASEAYPSPTDVREAHEAVPYIIVSLAHDEPLIRAFLIIKENWGDKTGDIEEIPVVLDG